MSGGFGSGEGGQAAPEYFFFKVVLCVLFFIDKARGANGHGVFLENHLKFIPLQTKFKITYSLNKTL